MQDFPTYSLQRMKNAEAAAEKRGVALLTLMENAGVGVCQHLRATTIFTRLLIVCGKGNNGGDALVIARHLASEAEVFLLPLYPVDSLSDLARINAQALPANIHLVNLKNWQDNQPDLIIDAIFGTGFSGSLNPTLSQLIDDLNHFPAYRIALDIPSGIHGEKGLAAGQTAFRADRTYTFGAYKPAHHLPELKPFMGDIIAVDIGLIPSDGDEL